MSNREICVHMLAHSDCYSRHGLGDQQSIADVFSLLWIPRWCQADAPAQLPQMWTAQLQAWALRAPTNMATVVEPK